MNQSLLDRLIWWFCNHLGHPFIRKGWVYNGQYHRDCRVCNRIVSEPVKEQSK